MSRREITCMLISLGLSLLLLIFELQKKGWSLDRLVCVGHQYHGAPAYQSVRHAISIDGYDGQFYYALAQHPLEMNDVKAFDYPAARHLRLLYPLFCWILSMGGDPELLFYVMPIVNLIAIMLMTLIGCRWVQRQGISCGWGLVLPVSAMIGLPLMRNLSDAWGLTFLIGLLYLWQFKANPTWLFFVTLATLFSREQNLPIVLGLSLFAIRQQEFKSVVALWAAIVIWFGWIMQLNHWYGVWPFLPTKGNFSTPFAGLMHQFDYLTSLDYSVVYLQKRGITISLWFVLFFVQWVVAISLIILGSLDPTRMLLLLAAGGLSILGGPVIWHDPWAFVRVLTFLPVALWIHGVMSRQKWLLVLLSGQALIPFLMMAWKL
jgi:hypothetical protein